MPQFAQGKVWLECQDQPMKEYGETSEDHVGQDGQQTITKTCFVEVVPNEKFVARWFYHRKSMMPQGVTFRSQVNGQRADGYQLADQWSPIDFYHKSVGFRTSDTTVMPYVFKPCNLTDDENDKIDPQFGTFTVLLEPLVIDYSARLAEYHLAKRTAVSKLDYHVDSKAAVVGFSIGYAQEQASSDPLKPADYTSRRDRNLPIMKVVFLYRTRSELISRGFIQEKKHQTVATGKTEDSDDPVVVSGASARGSKKKRGARALAGDSAAIARAMKEEGFVEIESPRKRARGAEQVEAGPSRNTSHGNVAAKSGKSQVRVKVESQKKRR